jgi:hydroxymethylglutaryl-CoA lyase
VEVVIRDCGPRDGLQGERALDPGRRADLARALGRAGLPEVEAAAFVSPTRVPAMAGAADVLGALDQAGATVWWSLVPNVRGAELALAAGSGHISVTVSASAGYSEKNVGMSVENAIAEVGRIVDVATAGSAAVDAVVSCCFGSPFDDVPGPDEVAAIVEQLRAAGVARVTLADTTGTATPRRVRAVLDIVGIDVGLHLHDTRATALTNAYAALEHGVCRFDTSVGGLGGSPFAPGAGGNLATEDLVLLLDDLGVTTGVDLEQLLAISAGLGDLVGHEIPSRVAAAGRLSAFG